MDLLKTPERWYGSSPYCLVIQPNVGDPALIDLDQPGWLTAHAGLMRVSGLWFLANKNLQPILMLEVLDGEQPYYTARHIGQAFGAVTGELVFHGIGKKRKDGHTDRLWITPVGAICVGDDPEPLTARLLPVLQAERN